jgi:hypothetical protein
MTIESPFIALIWVFAISALVVGAVIISVLGLAARHGYRRRSGIYARIWAENPSSDIPQILTVGDYLTDPSLKERVQRQLIEEVHESEGSAPEGRANSSAG